MGGARTVHSTGQYVLSIDPSSTMKSGEADLLLFNIANSNTAGLNSLASVCVNGLPPMHTLLNLHCSHTGGSTGLVSAASGAGQGELDSSSSPYPPQGEDDSHSDAAA